MRIEDFHDLGLNEEELAELEQSLQLIGQAVQQEEEIPLPDSLRGEALLHLLDGVEQDAPDEEPVQEKTKPAGRLIFGVFPQKYLAAAAMLALAVMVGVAYNRLPRTAEIGTNEIGSSMASQEAPADSGSSEEVVSPADSAPSDAQGETGYASVLNQINDRYNREDKPVYYRGPVSEQEPQAEESQQKDNPQSGEYRAEPEESEAAAEEPKKDSSMPKAPGNTADQAIQPEAYSVDSSSADAGAAAQEAPPANESNSLMAAQGSVQADAANGIAADEAEPPAEEPEPAEDTEEAPSTTQFRVASMENRLSVEADTGYTYILVPDEQDQCQAVLKVTSESTSAEPALVEITSEEPVAYSRVLYDDGNLIVVGNLLEYPEEYLQMTRTVYEEVGIEGKEVTSDLRNSFTEMTQVTVYSVSEENPADLSLSRDYYQAGWCRDAAVTESGTLYTVTNKSIYGVNGVTEYLTEVIPVVGTKAELSYLDVNRIYVDDLSSELDSYVVVCGLDLTRADGTLDAVAYLGDQMPVARIAEDGIYLGRTVTGEDEATSRMIRFEGSNLSSVTESENISGLLIPRSFVSLPDTGCAVLTGQSEGTGGRISECTVLVLDRSLGTAAAVQVPVSPKEITSVEVLSQTMLIHTAEKTYQVDFTAPLSPEVSVRV